MLVKDQAICIRAVDYSETSQVVTFFTRDHGKLTAIAKGSKRPKSAFDGPIELLSFGKVVFADSGRRTMATLTEFEQQPGLSPPARNLTILNCCLFAAELLNALTDEYDPHPRLFDRLLTLLQDAGRVTSKADAVAILVRYQLALLREIGLKPVFDHCANCKRSFGANRPDAYFSSSANGLLCRDCEGTFPDRIRLSRNAAAYLAGTSNDEETPGSCAMEIERLLVAHFTAIVNRPPKMAKYVLNT